MATRKALYFKILKSFQIRFTMIQHKGSRQRSGDVKVYFKRIHMKLVVRIAPIVPLGIDLWASFKSPDRLDPAIIPTQSQTY